MQRVEAYRIEIPIVAKDEYSGELDKADKAIGELEKNAKNSAKAQDEFSKSSKSAAKAQADLSKSAQNASKGVQEIGKSAEQTEKKFGRTMKTVESFGNKIKSVQRAKATVELAVKDNATRVMDRVRGSWESFRRNPITRLTVTAVDRAMRVLRGIRNTVLSIPTMITIGLSYVGIKNLGQATVGAAMNWEQYEVSMEHWLDGNTKKAKELTKWMGEFADITPFSSPELFPALTRAVSISDKDLDKSKRLLAIASDMAALTPDRSVEDAMQAISNSKMGNNVMLQGFGIDISKEQMDDMGGWDKVVDHLEKKFKDGALKLSKTASGVLATLKGYRSSLMRSIGTGFLEPMKPRLDAINNWLAENQETWGRWKDIAMGHGKDVSEGIFSTLERGFGHIRSNYLDNPEFIDLNIQGKIKFISADLGGYLNETVKPKLIEWWDETGSGVALEIGKSIGSGIIEGIKLGMQAGGELIQSSYSDLFTNFKETGFSKETGKSAMIAGATTIGAGYLAKRMIYNPVRSAYRGSKKVKERAKRWSDGGADRKKRRQDKWNDSNDKRTERRITRGDKARERAEQKKLRGKGRSSGFRSVGALGKLGGPLRALSLLNMVSPEGGLDTSALPQIGTGMAGAMAGGTAGAAIGSVIPGIGTIIGGITGSIIGGIGGEKFYDYFEESLFNGEWWSSKWDSVKSWTSSKWASFTDVWEGAKESIGSTLFSSEWWTGKWEGLKAFATSTFLSSAWWAEQAGYVWGTLETTLFSGEWWMGKWDSVKGWTSEKWEEWSEIYENAKTRIGETLFSGEWWSGKWGEVKGWTSEKWSEFGEIWSSARDAISSTLFSAEWWSGKWGQVKSWAATAWDNITSGFQVGRNKAGGGKSGAGGGGGGATAYARGGIARSPHLGLVAEAGVPEAMIPWDGSSRSKSLWQQTGEALGMFDGGSSSGNDSSTAMAVTSTGGGTAVSVGDVYVDGGNNLSAEEITEMIMPVIYNKIKASLSKR